MTETQVLGLTNNKLTGTIPDFFGKFRSIKTLLLGGNNLEGKIPDNFINMVSFNNKLTGKLPI
jgi:hypothetical protein